MRINVLQRKDSPRMITHARTIVDCDQNIIASEEKTESDVEAIKVNVVLLILKVSPVCSTDGNSVGHT